MTSTGTKKTTVMEKINFSLYHSGRLVPCAGPVSHIASRLIHSVLHPITTCSFSVSKSCISCQSSKSSSFIPALHTPKLLQQFSCRVSIMKPTSCIPRHHHKCLVSGGSHTGSFKSILLLPVCQFYVTRNSVHFEFAHSLLSFLLISSD